MMWQQNKDSGIAGVISMVDNFILQDALGISNAADPNAYIKPTLTNMPLKNVRKSDIMVVTGEGSLIGLTLFLGTIALFGRLVYLMLYEKYTRVSDNMKNMGMSTITNMMAWLLFKTIENFILSILCSLLCRAFVFPNQYFYNVFLLYFMTTQFMIILAIFMQTFFTNIKQGTFFAMVLAAIFFMTQVSLDTNDEPSKSFLRRAALSPIAGVKLAAKNMIIYEAQYNTFKDWSLHVGNFQFRVWF